jgi:hypothetical protein
VDDVLHALANAPDWMRSPWWYVVGAACLALGVVGLARRTRR